ncbi:MAG: M3 family oligoendopeptidase [Pirellulales bacterium]
MITQDFRSYTLAAPEYDEIAEEYDQLFRALDVASSGDEAVAAVQAWDALRRRLSTWNSLVNIRFHQDTRNDEYKRARAYCDELEPKLTNLAVAMKRRLKASPHRDALVRRFGTQVFQLWDCDIAAFDPAIEDDLVREAKLQTEYTSLLASPRFDFMGEKLTLSEITKFSEFADREVRHAAARARWGWFNESQQPLDDIFDQLVRLRQQMAEKLGYENFIAVGYERMHRVDYDQTHVERFRAEVRDRVVPLATEIRERQAAQLSIDRLMAWDESVHDLAGNPRPQGDHDWMVQRAEQMFADIGAGMDEFFEKMSAAELMDLKSREGKAGGGFCDVLPDFGMPFIYANFNGTRKDVEVFTHEMGHAFQVYSSLHQPLLDYFFPTTESCEIHSMGLEFLTWPQMELFFGDDAARFRRLHLTESMLFLPYGVAVDHFQHLVYAAPNASPDERAAMWQEMERTYLPWLDWGDLAHPASGRRWQAQIHIFSAPFYYIDYTLALTCALQLWVRASENRDTALADYVQLCRRGGEAPFRELVESTGLKSPFDDDCLEQTVRMARRELGL